MARGFTLIEILVVLILLGILATSVVPALPDSRLGAHRNSARAWQEQAETAARQASREARDWAWQVNNGTARLLVEKDATWRPAELQPPFLPLAEGLALERLEIDGHAQAPGSLIRFGATPPLFVVRLGDGARHWQIAGLPSGLISLEEMP